MKTLFAFLLFSLISNISFAQNIVPNYSFEQADSCPIFLNVNSYEYSLGCLGWGEATAGNPDYFNACDTATVSVERTIPWVGVPYNNIGYQAAYEGKAYVGINMYVQGPFDNKEYLITNIPPLEIDTAYEVTIHISLADSCEYATDGMGVLFTTYGSPNQYTLGTIIKTPQIDYSSYGIISDSTNWVTLKEVFIADSAYTSLIIGGFKSSSEMKTIIVNNYPSNPHTVAYYYIDAVIVEKLSGATIITSINNNINNDVKIYPNPFSDYTNLIFNNPYNQNNTLIIFNAQGQIVQNINNITSDRIRIDRNNLPTGFYYYQLRNETDIIAHGKIIIV